MNTINPTNYKGDLIRDYLLNLNGAISPRSLVFPFADKDHLILGTKREGLD